MCPRRRKCFQYDADGNLTNDGRWAYVWDAENRLIQMTVNTNVGPQYQVSFAYDPRNRRIQKLVVSNSVALYTNRFLYDGWNLVAILNPQSSLLQSFVWGSDLSGSLQGAGGVGGLLMANASGTNCFPAFDGNGNVMGLVNVADGATVASYAYGPFGELIQKTGAMADNIPFRFSTKYQDDESDLLYYGYRYYKQSTGTWPNRDPLEEKGGLNLYGFVGNDSLNHIDYLGLSAADVKNLEELARKITEQLTKECLRRNGGNLNNILSSIQKLCGCKAYLGCGEQAAALAGKLNNTKTDSKWKFYYENRRNSVWHSPICCSCFR